MRKGKIVLICVGTFFLLVGGFAGGVILNGTYFPSKNDIKDYQNNDWMNYIRDEVKVNDVIMPGSHDAGSYNINWLAKTQGYNIKTQLEMGTRYFDLRVNKVEDEYFLYHAYFDGEIFTDALENIVSFIENNPSETLILDFQHFKGDSENDVLAMIQTSLLNRDLLIKNETDKSELQFISELTIKEARGKCIVLFGDYGIATNYNYLFSRNNDECDHRDRVLNSYYYSEYHSKDSKSFISEALPMYYEAIDNKIEGEGYKGLFVLQGQLTDGKLIFGPYSKEKTHNKNMNSFIMQIKDDSHKLSLSNIIMRDFLTYDKCEDIIALNGYKNNVKEESLNIFVEKFDYLK